MSYRIAQDAGLSAPEFISETSSQQRNDLVLAQVHALYSTSWFTSAGAIVTAMTFWGAYLVYTGDRRVLIWAAMVHGTQALRLLNGWAYQKDDRAWQRMPIWRRRFMGGLLVSALVWGSVPWFVLPTQDLAMVCLMMLVMLGMGSAAIGAIVAYRPAIWTWMIPLLLPLPGLLLWHQGPLHNALAIFSVAYLGVNLVFAFGQNELLVKALKAQFDNAELVSQLRHQMSLAAQADKEKSRFVASASHDLRQPMHALGLFASALEKRLAGTSEAPLVGNLNRCIESLDRSFNAMLDISKLDAGVVEPQLQSFPIRDVFRRLHMHFAGQAEGAGLHLRFKPGGKHVTSDPQLLERILSNLIQNAIKYTRDGGIVVVARTHGTDVNIEVWDTGIGIPEAELPRVFDEFYQLHNPERDRNRGLGMGLAIVKRLALLLNHPLTVASTVGKGTMIRLAVPQTDLNALHGMNLEAETVPSPIGNARTLLFIDDEENIRESMALLLREWDYEVLVAGNINEACMLAANHPEPIHAVLSDLRLRNGEDGLQAINAVRHVLGYQIPAVLVTGDTSPDQVKRVHDSGHRVLFKPVLPKELFSMLRQLS
ncbi:MAG: hybrid sensor histidine kinase/response regulator [Aquabacterium sp.]|uniref:hybrid sensor histidine kinase/response regulator n=1 Tax=Aquabacterium sp. TaxID=1872578 RepID=UPI001223D2D2|nr:hybrid sensor histidine kinase/response regulator [Aquabacterium sp.]TAK88792.1 MAG: hybrid sensor histidine kinase/response regulator [Aquabacterium sp.]